MRSFGVSMGSTMVVGGVLLAIAPAAAQTLAQKQMMKQQDALLSDEVPSLNQTCGTKMKATIDWSAFLKEPVGSHSINGYCAEPLHSMRSMCSDSIAKEAIASKIKSYTCTYGGDGKRSLALDADGKLTMTVDWEASNYDQFIKAWLGDHL